MKAAFNLIVPFRLRRPLKTAAGAALLVAVVLASVQLVFAEPPVADFTISDTTPLVGDNVTFTSTVTDPNNDVTEIAWDFDYDGTTFTSDTTGLSPTADTSYGTAGARTVALRVTDAAGAEGDGIDVVLVTHDLTVEAPNIAPTASFIATPSTAQIGQTVNFNGSGSSDSDGTVARYEWDLDGNGSFETDSGTSATTSRFYSSPGAINVKLRVTDNDGAVSEVATTPVTVNNAVPTASFTVTPSTAQIGQTVNFNGSASNDNGDPGGSIVNYEWDLDGDAANGFEVDANASPTTSRSYPTPGTRSVRLRVTDNNAPAAPTPNTLTVNNAPPTASFTATPTPPQINQPISLNGT